MKTKYRTEKMIKISHLAIDSSQHRDINSTIKTMMNKPKTHCFGIDCNVFYSSSV